MKALCHLCRCRPPTKTDCDLGGVCADCSTDLLNAQRFLSGTPGIATVSVAQKPYARPYRSLHPLRALSSSSPRALPFWIRRPQPDPAAPPQPRRHSAPPYLIDYLAGALVIATVLFLSFECGAYRQRMRDQHDAKAFFAPLNRPSIEIIP